MDVIRRKLSLALLALPAGCAFRPLPELQTEPAAAPTLPPVVRPPALGQRWTYRKYNGFNSALLATETQEVVGLEPRIVIRIRSDAGSAAQEEHHRPWGRALRETGWDHVQNYEQALALWPADLEQSSRSVQRTYYRLDNDSYRYWITQHTTVRGWERVALARGNHLALRIEKFIRIEHRDSSRSETIRRDVLWLAPEIGRWVARDISGEYFIPDGNGSYRGLEENHRWELVDWT